VLTQTADAYTDTPTATPTITSTPSATPNQQETVNAELTAFYLESAATRAFTPITANGQWQRVTQTLNGVEMVLVPPGCFMMGSTEQQVDYAMTLYSGGGREFYADEQPSYQQCFDQPFWIDRTEVTNAQFAAFNGVAANASNQTDPNRPRERLTWFEARDYCVLRGGRLPTEAEWEYAARGPDGLIYPWGNDFIAENVVYRDNSGSETAEVGSRPSGASWVGALDMSGNVWEWTRSLYQDYPYVAGDGREEDNDRTDVLRSVRGGSFINLDGGLRAAIRNGSGSDIFYFNLGLRCVLSYT
jgi:formylglycine-generating enzyme required for sulfatase activity